MLDSPASVPSKELKARFLAYADLSAILGMEKSHTHPPRIDVERQLFSSHLAVIELSLLYTSISVFLVLLALTVAIQRDD